MQCMGLKQSKGSCSLLKLSHGPNSASKADITICKKQNINGYLQFLSIPISHPRILWLTPLCFCSRFLQISLWRQENKVNCDVLISASRWWGSSQRASWRWCNGDIRRHWALYRCQKHVERIYNRWTSSSKWPLYFVWTLFMCSIIRWGLKRYGVPNDFSLGACSHRGILHGF